MSNQDSIFLVIQRRYDVFEASNFSNSPTTPFIYNLLYIHNTFQTEMYIWMCLEITEPANQNTFQSNENNKMSTTAFLYVVNVGLT